MTTKAKDGRETLQERLQARIDKHRDPRGNICLGTYNHWDSALDLEAIGSLDAAQAEIARLKEAEDVLERNGFRRCDIAACNCNSWHFVGGFKARFDEIKQVVEDAGYSTNGRTLLDAVKHMAKDATPLPVAEDVVDLAEEVIFNTLCQQHPTDTTRTDAAGRITAALAAASLLRQPEELKYVPDTKTWRYAGEHQPEATPEGWQLVPKTPDENMIRAYKGAVKEYIQSLPESERQHTKTARGGYPVPERIKATVRFAAMLASAPTPASAVASDDTQKERKYFTDLLEGQRLIIGQLETALIFYRDGFEADRRVGPTGIRTVDWVPTSALLEDFGNVANDALTALASTTGGSSDGR